MEERRGTAPSPVHHWRHPLAARATQAPNQPMKTPFNATHLQPVERLLEAVTRPYAARPGLERYADHAPKDFGAYRTFCGT